MLNSAICIEIINSETIDIFAKSFRSFDADFIVYLSIKCKNDILIIVKPNYILSRRSECWKKIFVL